MLKFVILDSKKYIDNKDIKVYLLTYSLKRKHKSTVDKYAI